MTVILSKFDCEPHNEAQTAQPDIQVHPPYGSAHIVRFISPPGYQPDWTACSSATILSMSTAMLFLPSQFLLAKALFIKSGVITNVSSFIKHFLSIRYHLFLLGKHILIHTVMPSIIAIYFYILRKKRSFTRCLLPIMLCTGLQNGAHGVL